MSEEYIYNPYENYGSTAGYTTGSSDNATTYEQVEDARSAYESFMPAESIEDFILNAAASGALEKGELGIVLGNYGGYTTGSDSNAKTLDEAKEAQDKYKGEGDSSLMSKLERVWNWASDTKNQKNPLLMMGLMGISNAQNNAAKRDLADRQSRDASALVDQRYANERKTAEENSAAIMKVPKKQGIIQQALKRLDGTPVFNTNGTMK